MSPSESRHSGAAHRRSWAPLAGSKPTQAALWQLPVPGCHSRRIGSWVSAGRPMASSSDFRSASAAAPCDRKSAAVQQAGPTGTDCAPYGCACGTMCSGSVAGESSTTGPPRNLPNAYRCVSFTCNDYGL